MILVCGGAGYIGSHMVRRLLEEGRETAILDNLSTGHRQSIPEGIPFYEGDIRDRDFLDRVFQENKIEAVIHFCANSLVGESMVDPLKYYNNNLGGAISLSEAMVNAGVPYIIFSSTAATYGEPETLPITENTPTKPTNTYGETKLAMEKLFQWVSQAHNLKYVALRYFNVAGAYSTGEIGEDHSPETHLIPLLLEVPRGKRKEAAIFGTDYDTPDGTCIRDYIHVMDIVEGHLKALDYLTQGNPSNIFNLGTGKGFSVKEIIETARRVTGHPLPAVVKERRAGDPGILVANNFKAREVLGWEPIHSKIDLIMSSAWKWHKSHPEGYNG